MAMSTTEQNTLNQALNTAGTQTQVAFRTENTGTPTVVYYVCRLVPVAVMNAAQITAYAAQYSVTIASA